MKMRQVLGTVTIVVVIGATIYAIKKSKDAEKAEDDAISLEDAKRIVAKEQPASDIREVESFDKEYPTYFEEDVKPTIKAIKVTDEEELEEEEYEDIDETIEGPMIDPGETFMYQNKIEEEDELRFEPNSRDARNQYIRMELAEWVPLEDTYETMLKLFEFPFRPKNDGDEMLRTQIIDFRVQFFGFNSVWTTDVTFADILLHYARAAEFNCGESVRYWVEYFLKFNELDFTQPSHYIDHLLENLNAHIYFNEERQTFGLFGLSRESMDQAIKIANRNIDRSVTYEIEFNEFLKSRL